MRRVTACAMVVAILSAACTQAPPPTIGARDDAFLPYVEVSTSTAETTQPGGERARAYLFARRDKATGTVTTHALLSLVYVQKPNRHYDNVRNGSTHLLPMKRVFQDGANCRRATGCAHAEAFQVDIPEADLRKALETRTGYPLKLFSKDGHGTLFQVPPDTVAGLLRQLDALPPVAGAAAKIAKRN